MAENTEKNSLREVLMPVSAAKYGANYQSDMLTMYRDFVASAETVSDRRAKANSFYLAACTGFLATNSYIAFDLGGISNILIATLMGLVFSGVWMGLISSYKRLNGAKFDVIQEIEQHLPLAVFKAEEFVYKKPDTFMVPLTKYESYMPKLFIALYLGLAVWTVFNPAETDKSPAKETNCVAMVCEHAASPGTRERNP